MKNKLNIFTAPLVIIIFCIYLIGAIYFFYNNRAIVSRVNQNILNSAANQLKIKSSANIDPSKLSPIASNKTSQSKTTQSSNIITPAKNNPFKGEKLYVAPDSNAKRQADLWRTSRLADALAMDKIASQAQSIWFGDWNSNIQNDVSQAVDQVRASGALPVLVAYHIPLRDCGEYSAGGATSATAYQAWINGFSAGLAGRKSVVILEPDALSNLDCLSPNDQVIRYNMLQYASAQLSKNGAFVYLDAGNSRWHTPATIAERLNRIGLNNFHGFALNVSNFLTTAETNNYGEQISALVDSKHFVVDTSRNGAGPTSDLRWCNPLNRALGERPTTSTGRNLTDAYLWVKAPGESDGNCDGAPAAGVWWPEYALGLAQRAAY